MKEKAQVQELPIGDGHTEDPILEQVVAEVAEKKTFAERVAEKKAEVETQRVFADQFLSMFGKSNKKQGELILRSYAQSVFELKKLEAMADANALGKKYGISLSSRKKNKRRSKAEIAADLEKKAARARAKAEEIGEE